MTPRLDRVTRTFWRTTGRPVDLSGEHAWLDAPVHDGAVIGDAWLTSAAEGWGGSVRENVQGAGLLPDLTALDGLRMWSATVVRLHSKLTRV